LLKRLGKRGIAAAGSTSGEDALAHVEREPLDVVVLDVKMPGLDGIETLREIKKRRPLIEVIMLTGHASVEAAIEGMELGAFDYLMKPIEFESLLNKIQDAHKKKSLQEEKIAKMTGSQEE
jgi:DNA-binding NtrC family response regulator